MPGDWQPDCPATQLSFDASDRVWQGTFNVPAGNWEYKAALNGTWDENYGANAQLNGPNIGLSLAAPAPVKFYYDHATHWITDNHNSVIATAPGSYPERDRVPRRLAAGLPALVARRIPTATGSTRFSTVAIPPGDYEAKAAINESWDVNYGAGGVQNGAEHPLHRRRRRHAGRLLLRLAVDHVLTISQARSADVNLKRAEGALADARHARLELPAPSARVRRTASTTRATAG